MEVLCSKPSAALAEGFFRFLTPRFKGQVEMTPAELNREIAKANQESVTTIARMVSYR